MPQQSLPKTLQRTGRSSGSLSSWLFPSAEEYRTSESRITLPQHPTILIVSSSWWAFASEAISLKKTSTDETSTLLRRIGALASPFRAISLPPALRRPVATLPNSPLPPSCPHGFSGSNQYAAAALVLTRGLQSQRSRGCDTSVQKRRSLLLQAAADARRRATRLNAARTISSLPLGRKTRGFARCRHITSGRTRSIFGVAGTSARVFLWRARRHARSFRSCLFKNA